MRKPFEELSPRWKARIAGVFYLISGMAYSFADGNVRGKLVVTGDAAATAHNILTHLTLYRLGFAAGMASIVFYITVTLLLFYIFKPVNQNISLLAAFFSLAGCTIQAVITVFHLAPLIVLSGSPYLTAFKTEQLQALALVFLNLGAEGVSIYMVFFGCYCVMLGYLIFRSTFMPRILGVFMVIAGLSYQLFLSPPLAHDLFRYVVAPAGALGELSLILWLIIFGVNNDRWRERSAAYKTLV